MTAEPFALACPRPLRHDSVQMAHGGGGRLMKELIEGLFLPILGADPAGLHDSAVVEAGGARLAFTTDGFVVHPRLEFVGATCDGFVGADGAVELKCPEDPSRHLWCWSNGRYWPKDRAQVQAELWPQT